MIAIAQRAALEAGKLLKGYFGKIKSEDIREKDKNDFLTFADEAAEREIIKIIQSEFPDHSFLAEEGGDHNSGSKYTWIIDPLDGTRNFICGIPVFAVSIGLRFEKDMIGGVIYDVMRDEMYNAEKGKGAFLNGNRIQVSPVDELAKSVLGTGFPFRAKDFLKLYLTCFEDIFFQSSGMRRFGAAAIDLAYVACGRFEGFWELGLKPWDAAAGAVLIREAGGKITDFWNNTESFLFNSYVVGTNGKIHDKLIEIINQHFQTDHLEIKNPGNLK